jgi:hypothetical protein
MRSVYRLRQRLAELDFVIYCSGTYVVMMRHRLFDNNVGAAPAQHDIEQLRAEVERHQAGRPLYPRRTTAFPKARDRPR